MDNTYSNIHLLADFDGTLTQAFTEDQERLPGIIGLLRIHNILGKECTETMQALYEKYFPLEADPNITKEEKISLMSKWRNDVNNALIQHGLSKSHLDSLIEKDEIKLRNHRKEFFGFLHENNIPITIYSASGIGTYTIKKYLGKMELLNKQTHIISNDFIRDDAGNAIETKGRVMHTYNKETFQLSNYPRYNEDYNNRSHAIILGDSLGDITIGETDHFEKTTSIGFLNNIKPDQDTIKAYENTYDYVLDWDSGLQKPLEIIAEL